MDISNNTEMSAEELLERLRELQLMKEANERFLLEMHESQRRELTNEKLRFLNSVCYNDNPEELAFIDNLNEIYQFHEISEHSEIATSPTMSNSTINPETISTNECINYLNKQFDIPQNDEKEKSSQSHTNNIVDEVPITPKFKDFNKLLETELQNDSNNRVCFGIPKTNKPRKYLRRGEGLRRFKMSYDDIGRNNSHMPWTKKRKTRVMNDKKENMNSVSIPTDKLSKKKLYFSSKNQQNLSNDKLECVPKDETWASILGKGYQNEDDCAILDQNYVSDTSIAMSPSVSKFVSKKEIAEQKIFELIEKKLENASFSSTNSFLIKAFGSSNSTENNSKIDKQLFDIYPLPNTISSHQNSSSVLDDKVNIELEKIEIEKSNNYESKNNNDNAIGMNESSHSDDTTVSSDTEETCRIANQDIPTSTPNHDNIPNFEKKMQIINMKNSNTNKKSIVFKLINDEITTDSENISESLTLTENCTSETESSINEQSAYQQIIRKFEARTKELGKCIAILQNENSHLKEALEMKEKQFIEDKAQLETKLNEDKVIAEYYLAEEREKLQKKMSLYDRQIREMKGQLSQKDNEEIALLNENIVELKKQLETKNSKHGAMQARLRNQLKLLENENKNLKDECEKLKKENRKFKNLNSRTNKLANIKMLADINKSLATKSNEICNEDDTLRKNLSSETLSNVKNDSIKHSKPKSIEKQINPRARTKSAPNLNVTSKYAKFFSKKEKDSININNLGYGLSSDDDSESDSSLNNSPCDSNKEVIAQKSTYLDFNQVHDQVNEIHRNVSPKHKAKEKCFVNVNLRQELQNNEFRKIDSSTTKNNRPQIQDIVTDSDKKETIQSDGSVEICFSNGNCKTISADGSYSKFTFYNGDVKEVFFNEGIIKYFYKNQNIHQTSYKDGSEVLHFPDNYIERRYSDGTVQSHLPDGTVKWIKPGEIEECRFPDGTLVSVNNIGEQTIRFPNGQVEIHTSEFMKREFPDGSVKIAYADGIVETRFASGRIRIKDKLGNLIMDTNNRLSDSHNS